METTQIEETSTDLETTKFGPDITPEDPILDTTSSTLDSSTTSLSPLPDPPEGPPLPPPDDEGARVRRHETFARTIEAAMQESAAPREEKRRQADDLETLYTDKHLEPGIALTITFGPQQYADYQDADLLIAPNDTEKKILFPLTMPPEGETTDPSLVETLVRVGTELAQGKKTKKKEDIESNDPLKFLIDLYGKPPAVREQVVRGLEMRFGDLLEKARYDRLWANEDTTTAVLGLIQYTLPAVAQAQVRALLQYYPLEFDFTVDRFEARLAWEMLHVLPAEEQAKLLDGIPLKLTGDESRKEKKSKKKANRKDNDLSRKLNGRAEKNMSVEYTSSTHFDTYVGNEEGELDWTTKDQLNALELEGDEIVALDSDREALLASALDPALWAWSESNGSRSFDNRGRLEGVLELVIQADEGSIVTDLVAQHYLIDSELFQGLGFIYSDNGTARHYQQIDDDTFTTALGRTIAGIKSVFDLIDALSGIWQTFASDVGGTKLNLGNIEKAFLGKFAGVHLDHSEEIKDKMGVLSVLLGGASVTKAILGQFSLAPDELLEILGKGKDAATRLQTKIDQIEIFEESDSGEETDDPTNVNKIVLTRNDELGITNLSIPKLAIAGQAAAFGTTSTKMGPSYLKGGKVTLRNRTADNGEQYVTIDLEQVELTKLLIMNQQSMMQIQKIGLTGLHLELHARDAKPKSMLTRVLTEVQRGVIQAIRMLPASMWVSLGIDAAGMIEEGVQLSMTGADLASGDYKQVGLKFSSLQINGFQDSRGNHLDELSIGDTDVTLDQGVGSFDSWKERQKASGKEKTHKDRAEKLEETVEARRADGKDGLWTQYLEWCEEVRRQKGDDWEKKDRAALKDTIARYTTERDKIIKKMPEGYEDSEELSEAKEIRRDQIDWYNKQIVLLERRDELYDQLETKHLLLDEKEEELKALLKKFEVPEGERPIEPDKAQKKQIAELNKTIMVLKGELLMLEGGKLDGHLGEVNMSGLSYGGTSVGSVKVGKITMDADTGNSDQTGHMHTDQILITDLSMSDGLRRDQVLAAELDALDKDLANVLRRLTKLEGQETDRYEPAKIVKKRELTGERERLEKRRGDLQGELMGLQPLLKEYDALRRRLTDNDYPLSESERTRYLQIRETLAQPPSVKISKVSLTDVDLNVGVTDVSGAATDVSGVQATLKAGKTEITGVTLDSGRDGQTTVGSITATDADVSLRQVGKTKGEGTEGEGTEGILGVSATDMTISDVRIEGTGDARMRTAEEICIELEQVNAEITRLRDEPQTADVKARLKQLELRRTALAAQEAQVQAKLNEPTRLQELIETLEKARPGLVDADGNDRFRGFSYLAAKDSVLEMDTIISEIKYGKEKGDMVVSLSNARRWVKVYSKAQAATLKALQELQAREPDHNTTDLSDESEVAFWERDKAKLEEQYATIGGQLKIWQNHKIVKGAELAKANKQKAGYVTLAENYLEVVRLARSHGLEVGMSTLRMTSAFVMGKAAKAQISGFATTDIEKIAAQDINLDISGISSMLGDNKRENLLGDEVDVYNTPLVIQGGKRKKSGTDTDTDTSPDDIVGSLTVEGVTSTLFGEEQTLVKKLEMTSLSGTIVVKSPNDIEVKGLSLDDMSLSGVDWTSTSYDLATPGELSMSGITVDAAVKTDDFGAMTGTITNFSVETITSDALKLRMDDYLFELGKLSAGEESTGKQVIKGLTMSGYNIANGVFGSETSQGVTIRELNTSGLCADLSGGMIVEAKKLSAKNMGIKALLTDAAKESVKKESGRLNDAEKADELVDLPEEYAERYEMDIGGMSANDLRIQMQESGIDVNISHLRAPETNGQKALKGFYYDMTTGDFGFASANLRSIGIGPLKYDDAGMYVKIMDLDLANVEISAHGKMPPEAAKDREARIAAGKPPPEPMALTFSLISSSFADLDMLTYRTRSPSGEKMDVTLKHATTDKLVIRDYDFVTSAMDISMDQVFTEGLDIAMRDGLSSSHIVGDFDVKHMDLGLLKDGSMTIDLKEASSTTPLTYEDESTEQTWSGKSSKSETAVTTSLDNLSGNITMDEGIKDSANSSKTSFSKLSLDALALPTLSWKSSTGGDLSKLDASGINLKGIEVSGYTSTKMVNRRIGGQVVPMPETDLYLEYLNIGEVTAVTLTYFGRDDLTDVNNSDEDRNTSSETVVTLRGATMKTLEVSDLQYIGGEMVGGGINLDSIDTALSFDSDAVNRRANPLMDAATTLSAQNLFVKFIDGDTIQAGMEDRTDDGQKNILVASGLQFGHSDGEGNVFQLTEPGRAAVSGLGVTLTETDEAGKLGSDIKAHVGSLTLLDDVGFSYTASGEHAVEMDPDRIQDDIDGARAAKADETLAKRLEGINWDDFLDTVNGLIGADITVDSDYDFEVSTEVALFGPLLGGAIEWMWDPIDDVEVDPLSVNHAHIGIPIINGVTNRTLIQAASGLTLNLLLEIISMLVTMVPVIGKTIDMLTRVAPVSLDLLSDTIPTFGAPDTEKLNKQISKLKTQKFAAQVMKGAAPELWDQYADQIKTYEDIAVVAATMRADGYTMQANILQAVGDTWFAPEKWERASFDVFLDNLNVDLTAGPLSGSTTFDVPGTTDKITESYGLGDTRLLLADTGKGNYALGIQAGDIAFESTRSDAAGKHFKKTKLGVGSLTLGGALDNLFPDGKIYLSGAENPVNVNNTMTGELKAGTNLKDIDAQIKSLYQK